jgi:hypothetical protein
MSYRLQVTIADEIADELDRRAQTAGQPASRVAATLINLALNSDTHIGRRNGSTAGPVSATRLSASRASAQPPSWIEPIARDDRRVWRSELWGAVLALCARYPKELQRLEASWWRDRARIEQLAALDAWRFAIDQTGTDPREELAFHHQLADLRYVLEHTPGVGADTFTPPPHEWLDPSPSDEAAPTPRSAPPRLTRDEVLDAREVADLLHMPMSTALDLARRGIIPGHKLGRRWIFLRDEIDAGVRGAPNHSTASAGPEPPARHAEGRSPNQSKRYPRAVPAAATASQRQLFS